MGIGRTCSSGTYIWARSIRCGFNTVFFLQLGLATVLEVVVDLLLEVVS